VRERKNKTPISQITTLPSKSPRKCGKKIYRMGGTGLKKICVTILKDSCRPNNAGKSRHKGLKRRTSRRRRRKKKR
jgi:hypothetical protein